VAETRIRAAHDIVTMKAVTADEDSPDEVDTVHASLAAGFTPPEPRAVITSSACGVCSARHVTGIPAPDAPLHSAGWSVPASTLLALPATMREHQRTFDRTGGLHAAAVADVGGALVVVREDVGRHNAVDKVLGHCLLDGRLPLADHLLAVSGRVSFEIVQKAISAGVAGVVAVSAPSSLAVDLAREHSLLLAAFCRGSSMNVYSRPDLVGDDR
jgi:FdhD protein